MSSTLVFAASQWGLLASAAKLGQLEDVGIFSLALVITGPAMISAYLNLRMVQATDLQRDYRFRDYLGLRLVCIFIAVLFIAVMALASRYSASVLMVIAMVTLAKALDLVSDVFHGLFQQFDRMDMISRSRILQGILQVVIFSAFLYATKSIVWATVAMAASSAVALAYVIPFALTLLHESGESLTMSAPASGGQEIPPPPSKTSSLKHMWQLFLLALPLGIAAPLLSLQQNIPRYYLDYWMGERALGIFTAMSYIVFVAGNLVTGAYIQSSVLYLTQAFRDDIDAYVRLVWRLLGVATASGVAGFLVAWIGSKPLLTLLYNTEYGKHPQVFMWLMIGATPFYIGSVFSGALASTRTFQVQTVSLAVTVVATILASVFLIPRYGMLGAAWSWTLGVSVWALILGAILYQIVSRRIQVRFGQLAEARAMPTQSSLN